MRRKGTSALLAGAAPFLATVPAEGGPEWPISLLTSNGRRAVAGHTTRHERHDNDCSTGIRNIAFDSMAGFNAAVFIRTAKLKEYPRNGDHWQRGRMANITPMQGEE